MRNASRDDAVREYYPGVPPVLEIAEHAYLETDLMVLFRAQMAMAQCVNTSLPVSYVTDQHTTSASADTVARIYNLGLAADMSSHAITPEHVWNAFYIHALLEDKSRRNLQLQVPHNCIQSSRFTAALDERNRLMAGVGQPLWAHACDECEHVIVPSPDAEDQSWCASWWNLTCERLD